MAVKVTLRSKKISKGRKSLYLDFYPPITNPKTGKETRREFLGIYIYEKTRSPFETQHNKEAKALAESIRNLRFKEIQEGIYGFQSDAKKKMSFLDFFKKEAERRYTSKGNYDNWLNAYRYCAEYFDRGLSMGELSVEQIEDYKEHLLTLTLAQNTKHAYFNKLKAACKQAFKKGYIPENFAARVDGIKSEETHREILTMEELKLLAKTECEKPLFKKAFLFSALTGLRFSDIQKLKWSEIQYSEAQGNYLRFQQKKTKGQETLDIPIPARELLGDSGKPEQLVFPKLKYSAWNNLKIREWVMRAEIKKKITFHCARHSFATLQLTLGTDIYTVSKMLGHKELKTTQIYAKIVDQKKREAADRLNDFEL